MGEVSSEFELYQFLLLIEIQLPSDRELYFFVKANNRDAR